MSEKCIKCIHHEISWKIEFEPIHVFTRSKTGTESYYYGIDSKPEIKEITPTDETQCMLGYDEDHCELEKEKK